LTPRIDPEEYQKRLDQMTELFAGIVAHAQELSAFRCPYKDRDNCCTAGFGCRNKRKAVAPGALPACAGDDKLDYRSAWETA
jgi:hypothetical protein